MPITNLSGRYLQDSFKFVTQNSQSAATPDKWIFGDGEGVPITWIDATASWAETASYALNGGGTPGGPTWSIQFNSASTFSGSSYFTYDFANSHLYLTGAFSIVSNNNVTPQPFVPTDITDIAIWLNNDDISTLSNGDPIPTWVSNVGLTATYDDFSSGVTYTDTSFTTTVGNIGAAQLSFSTYFLSTDAPLNFATNPEATFFVVFAPKSTEYNVYGTDPDGVFDSIWRYDATGDGNIELFTTANVSTYPTSMPDNTSGTGFIASVVSNTNIEYFQNGTTIGSIASTFDVGPIGHYMGYTTGATVGTGNVDVIEVIAYNRSLTLSERQQVEGYLAWKFWGADASTILPVGHAYALQAPTTTSLPTENLLNFYDYNGILVSYIDSGGFFSGSASYALNSATASLAYTASFVTASNVWGPYGSSSVYSASWAETASFAQNINIGNVPAPGDPNQIIYNSGGFFDGANVFYYYDVGDPAITPFGGGNIELRKTSAGPNIFRSSSHTNFIIGGNNTLGVNPPYVGASLGYQGLIIGDGNTYNGQSTFVIGGANTISANAISSILVADQSTVGSINNTNWSIANGIFLTLNGPGNHVHGILCEINASYAHAEGRLSKAFADYSHAEGGSITYGQFSHAEGASTAFGTGSHAEGELTVTIGKYSHAEGQATYAFGTASHAEGYYTTSSGNYSHAEGQSAESAGAYSHAEGINTITFGVGSHAEGNQALALGDYSHAEGGSTNAWGQHSHAEGNVASSWGDYSHAEGAGTANGFTSHAEGFGITNGDYSHAEGTGTAAGNYSHAEGQSTQAIGDYSHAEGDMSEAIGTWSHANGIWTVATRNGQNTVGEYNLRSNTTDFFVIGDGTDDTNRHDLLNASTGVIRITGSLIVSNSFELIGTGNVSGSLTVSNSLNVIGISNVTGSNNITGSWQLIGDGAVTGSFTVSSSLNVIGTSTVTGSNVITGSWQLIGNGTVTGSLIVSGTLMANVASLTGSLTGSFIGTGSGNFSGIFSGSNTTGVSFFGTSSWAVSASNAITASYSLTTRAAGVDTNVQYNANGVLGATSNLSFNRTNQILIIEKGTSTYQLTAYRNGYDTVGLGAGVVGTEVGLYDASSNKIIAAYDPTRPLYYYSNGNQTYDGTTHYFGDDVGISGSLQVRDDVFFIGLSQANQANVVTIDIATGKLYYTASTAVGGTTTPTPFALTEGVGISDFSFDGSNTATVAVSGAAALTPNFLTQWTGNAFSNSTIENMNGHLLVRDSLYVSNSFRVLSDGVTISNPAFQVDSVSGVTSIGQYVGTPVAQAGGIYFDGTDWYFGV